MRNWETTRFTRTIRISDKYHDYIKKTKIKKSLAGRLEEILKDHLLNKEGSRKTVNK